MWTRLRHHQGIKSADDKKKVKGAHQARLRPPQSWMRHRLSSRVPDGDHCSQQKWRQRPRDKTFLDSPNLKTHHMRARGHLLLPLISQVVAKIALDQLHTIPYTEVIEHLFRHLAPTKLAAHLKQQIKVGTFTRKATHRGGWRHCACTQASSSANKRGYLGQTPHQRFHCMTQGGLPWGCL